MMFYSFALLISLVAGLCGGQKLTPIPIETVDELQLSSYVGRWYQMYSSLIPDITFEKKGYCITADYFNESTTSANNVSFNFVISQK